MKRIIFALLVSLPLVAAFFGASAVAAQTTPSSCLTISNNLSVGSTGASVVALQQFLNNQGLLSVAPTGYFGAMTAAAVKNFQASNNIPQVGTVGPITRAALQIATCEATNPNGASQSQSSQPQSTSTTTPQVFITITNPASSTAATSTASSTPSLPYHGTQFADWQAAWGDVSTTSTGALHLQGTLTNNGAEAIYPASMNWTNYKYTANVSVANGNISLIGRYQDSNNFLACSFAKGWIELDQVQDGTSTVLVSKALDGILPGTDGFIKNTTVDMTLNEGTVSCGGFGPTDNISYTFPLNTAPTSGGIGVESWYQTPLADQLDLIDVKVDPL